MTFSAYALAGDGRYRERFGLDFEDFVPGQRFRHRPGVTLSQQDNADEALDTMNAAMLHYDAHYAAQTTWKRPLMVSTITLQRAIGLGTKTFGRRRSISGFKEITMTGPVFGGDTIYASSEIIACNEGPTVDTGTVQVCTRVTKADGAEVAALTYDAVISRRGRGPDGEVQMAQGPRFHGWRCGEDGGLTEQVGLFFEDFNTGETFIHAPRRTFYWREAVEHAWRSFDWNPCYHDLDWIAKHADGKHRIAETFLIAAATPLTTRTFGRVVANLGWTDIALPNPVFAGDTIEAQSKVVDARTSRSRPNEGILTVETEAHNQDRKLVMRYTRSLLVYRRAAETPYAKAGY